jgi:hypothetical protein
VSDFRVVFRASRSRREMECDAVTDDGVYSTMNSSDLSKMSEGELRRVGGHEMFNGRDSLP